MTDTTELNRDLTGTVIIDEDRHDELTEKAALAEDLESELEEAKQTLQDYEDHLDIANGAYAAALAAEGPHSEDLYQDASLQAKRRELARLRGEDFESVCEEIGEQTRRAQGYRKRPTAADAAANVAALAQYSTGDVVSYGSGEKKTGVVVEVLTSTTEVPKGGNMVEVEASSDSPKYLVALGHTSGVDVFTGSDLSSGEINVDDLDSSTKDLKSDSGSGSDSEAANSVVDEEAALDFSYPESWRQSSTPNRIILLDAWSSMGGTWRSCYPEYGGKRFCSALKDKVLGTKKWRKGGG